MADGTQGETITYELTPRHVWRSVLPASNSLLLIVFPPLVVAAALVFFLFRTQRLWWPYWVLCGIALVAVCGWSWVNWLSVRRRVLNYLRVLGDPRITLTFGETGLVWRHETDPREFAWQEFLPPSDRGSVWVLQWRDRFSAPPDLPADMPYLVVPSESLTSSQVERLVNDWRQVHEQEA